MLMEIDPRTNHNAPSQLLLSHTWNMVLKMLVSQDLLATSSGQRKTSFSLIKDNLHENNYNFSNPPPYTVADLRDGILHIGVTIGGLCTAILSEKLIKVKKEQTTPNTSTHSPRPKNCSTDKELGKLFLQLFVVSGICSIDLCSSILKKVELNGRKYPVDLCKVWMY